MGRDSDWFEDPHFDVVVAGTDATCAIIAAACARAGQRVLHVDRNAFYGGPAASLDLAQFDAQLRETGAASAALDSSATSVALPEGAVSCECAAPGIGVEAGSVQIFVGGRETFSGSGVGSDSDGALGEAVQDGAAASDENEHLGSLAPQARRISIDAHASLFLARGAMIDALVQSTVAKYLEFKIVDSSYLWHDGAPRLVPGSRADVFRNKYISLQEKRLLSKFMGFVQETVEKVPSDLVNSIAGSSPGAEVSSADSAVARSDAESASAVEPFSCVLARQGLTPKLRDFVTFAISLLPSEQATAEEGLRNLSMYAQSLGRFDTHTPFIAMMYGVGELTQAFARLAAVFGGVYMLRCGIDFVQVDAKEDTVVQLRNTEGQDLTAGRVVFAASSVPPAWTRVARSTAHAAVVCNRAVIGEKSGSDDTSKTGNCLLVIPPGAVTCRDGSTNTSAVQIIQLGDEMGTSPSGIFTLHVSCTAEADANANVLVDILRRAVAIVIGPESEYETSVLYEAYWVHRERETVAEHVPRGCIVVDDLVGGAVPFESCVARAREVFHIVVGDSAEFLPAAPSSEDIVWEAGDEKEPNSGSLESAGVSTQEAISAVEASEARDDSQ